MWSERLARLDFEHTVPGAASLWGADDGSLHYVGTSANAVFRFTRGGDAYFLRMLHSALRSENAVAAAVAYLRHLHASGAQVCRPVDSERGRGVERLEQGGDSFFATVVAAAPGEPLRPAACGARGLQAGGAAIASVHLAAERFAPADPSLFLHFRDHWRASADSIPTDDEVAQGELRVLDEFLDGPLGKVPDPEEASAFGLSHADFNLGNLIYDGENALAIDFDEPVFHYWAADLARPLRDFLDWDRDARRGVIESLVAGYRSRRSLADHWVEALPWFVRVKDFEVYAWAQRPENRDSERLPGGNAAAELLRELRQRMRQPLEW